MINYNDLSNETKLTVRSCISGVKQIKGIIVDDQDYFTFEKSIINRTSMQKIVHQQLTNGWMQTYFVETDIIVEGELIL